MTEQIELQDVNTLAEAAGYLRLKERKTAELCRTGKLAAIQVGRTWIIPRESIRAYIELNAPALATTGAAPTAPTPPRRVGRTF